MAILEVQSAATPAFEPPWSFRIDGSFTITGRGTGTISPGPQAAILYTGQHTAIPVVVSLEYAKVGRIDRPALVIREVDKEQVPSGTLVRPRAVRPNL